MGTVVFALEWLPSYRVDFIELVAKMLAEHGHATRLIHGQPPKEMASRGTGSRASFSEYRTNKTFAVKSVDVVYQPVLRDARNADVVVVQQEASLLLNLLLASSVIRPKKGWAMWGNGSYYYPDEYNAVAQRLKAIETRRCGRFFAYTNSAAAVVEGWGLPSDRITVVRNTTETSPASAASPEIRERVEAVLARTPSVCAIVSSLDKWKRVEFLTEALDGVKERSPSFEFMVVGGGDGFEHLSAWASSRPWVHLFGNLFGSDKTLVGEAAVLTLHPGVVGLHAVDSFHHRAPMVTIENDYHGHELEYLVHDVNALVLPAATTADEYAEAVANLLADTERIAAMVAATEQELLDLTLEASAKRFVGGLLELLA